MHASTELAAYPSVRINGRPLPPEAMEFERLRLIRFYREHVSASPDESQLREFRRQAIEQAIGARLLMDEALRLDISVSEDEIDAQIRKTETDAGGADALNALLERQGLNRAEFRAQIERACRVEKLIAQAVADAPDPTESQIRAHFDANRERYQQVERVQGRHILVKPERNAPEAQRRARQKLESIRARIADGADFADEAAAHSDCPSGAQAGGSLGWVARGMMVPEFDAAVFDMEVGDLSELIKTQFGYHLVYKTGHDEGGPADFTDVSDKVRDFLRHVRRGEAVSAYVRDLRDKVAIDYT